MPGPRGDIPALWHAVLTQTDLEPGTAGPYSSCLETLLVAAWTGGHCGVSCALSHGEGCAHPCPPCVTTGSRTRAAWRPQRPAPSFQPSSPSPRVLHTGSPHGFCNWGFALFFRTDLYSEQILSIIRESSSKMNVL